MAVCTVRKINCICRWHLHMMIRTEPVLFKHFFFVFICIEASGGLYSHIWLRNVLFRSEVMLLILLACRSMTRFHDCLHLFFHYTSFWHILRLWHKSSDLWPFFSFIQPSGTIHVRHCSFLEACQFFYYSKLTLYIALIQLKCE